MTHKTRSASNVFSASARLVLLLACFTLPLSACDLAKNQLKADRSGNKEIQDYRDGLAERLPEVDELEATNAGVPAMQPYIAHGSEDMRSMPLVSISVNQSIPIRDVLFELAEQAEFDLELDPRIRGSLIFTARNRPLDEVVERISDMAGLRYKFEDEILRVELDTPYNKTYKIDYLSYIRKNAGSISSDVNVGASEGGADSGSKFTATSESESDFWGELEAGLSQMLGGTQQLLRTNNDPRITATEQNPDVAAVSPDGQGVAPPDAVLQVDSLPIDDLGVESEGEDLTVETSFALNKQAGLVSVYASQKQHKEVQEYLTALRRAVTAQVLIEAKVLEVVLNDENITGVDWSALGRIGDGFIADFTQSGSTVGSVLPNTFNAPNAFTDSIVTGNSNFVAAYNGDDIGVLVEALQGFGTVKALASPRLTVLNNHSAVLNVSTNQVFFELEVDITQADGGNPEITVESEIRNVPEGVIINVQPSIDLDRKTVAMAVRPTVTRVVNTENDPGLAFALVEAGFAADATTSQIPELNVQQIDSVIQVDSGQAVVMGGLLQDRAEVNEEGVPVLGEVPIVGSLFKDHRDLIQKTELIIFLKATILERPSDSVHNTDKDMYRTFSQDRRPFKL